MNRSKLERRLSEIERHGAVAERLISRQRALIGRLAIHRRGTTEARAVFQHSLEIQRLNERARAEVGGRLLSLTVRLWKLH
jgi:hypothetical protein